MMQDWNAQGEAFDRHASGQLYDYLVRPILASLQTRHLIVISPPGLESLPFEALFDTVKEQYLGEQIALSYSPSASFLTDVQSARSLRNAKILLAVGPELETHGAETRAIASRYRESHILREGTATFDNLLKQAGGNLALHIAAHALYDDEHAAAPRLVLTGRTGRAVHIPAAQLSALPLQGVEVVSVGACNAGTPAKSATGEIDGFVRSLFSAGAQSVVLPLWEVPDLAASHWFELFYLNAVDHDIPEAARLANSAMLRDPKFGSNPRYWAAYRVFGH